MRQGGTVRGRAVIFAVVCAGAVLGGRGMTLAQSAVPSPLEAPVRSASTVLLKEGRLSVHVENRSQDWILEEISRRAKVAVMRVSGSGEVRMSVHFEDLPLDEGLRRILRDQDAFFFYGGAGTAAASLRAVWVYAKGKGNGVEPVPPEAWASTKELERDLANPDPEVRTRAIEALIERRQDGARDMVIDALKDRNESVRTEALFQALDNDVALPADVLSDLALGDPSPGVRFLALDALAESTAARALAEKAAGDPDRNVRRRAQEILRDLDAASRPRSPAQLRPGDPSPRPEAQKQE